MWPCDPGEGHSPFQRGGAGGVLGGPDSEQGHLQLLGHLLVVASQTAKAQGLSEGYRVGK